MSDEISPIYEYPDIELEDALQDTKRVLFLNDGNLNPEPLQWAGYTEDHLQLVAPTLGLLDLSPGKKLSENTGVFMNFTQGTDDENRCEMHTINTPNCPSWIHLAGINYNQAIFHDGINLEMIFIQTNPIEASALDIFEIAMFTRFGGKEVVRIHSDTQNQWINNETTIYFKYPFSDFPRTNPVKKYQMSFKRIKEIYGMPYDAYIRTIDRVPEPKDGILGNIRFPRIGAPELELATF